MNDILLINRMDTQDHTEEKRQVFFQLGNIRGSYMQAKLMKIFKNYYGLSISDIIYKYNGVELNITVQQIPEIIKILTAEDIDIYSIFEIYNPKL